MEGSDLQVAPAQEERWARQLATQNGFKAGQQADHSGRLSQWGERRLMSKAELRQELSEMGEDGGRKTGRIKLLLDDCVSLSMTLNFTQPHLYEDHRSISPAQVAMTMR